MSDDVVVKLDTNRAPTGKVFVCSGCGRTSPHKHGGPEADEGWDSSCMTNSVLCVESTLIRGEDQRVMAADCDSGFGVSLIAIMAMRTKTGDRY